MLTEQRRMVRDPGVFGKVAVLLGGHSAEREVSLRSGEAVLRALQVRDIDAHGIDVDREVLVTLERGGFDRAFIALHGRGGEDGVIQGALETRGIPYTGSGVLGSALGMDKLRTKRLWQGSGLPTSPFRVLTEDLHPDRIVDELGLPLAVKPSCEGSSIGVSRVEDRAQVRAAWEQAARCDAPVFAEPWITGGEYTGALLQGEALPLICLETPREFYDYEAKYRAEDTVYKCPCGLDDALESELRGLVQRAFAAVGGYGWGRVDLMLDASGQPWLLEVNTVPGMTSHSLVPMAAKAVGIDFPELVWRILETSFERPL